MNRPSGTQPAEEQCRAPLRVHVDVVTPEKGGSRVPDLNLKMGGGRRRAPGAGRTITDEGNLGGPGSPHRTSSILDAVQKHAQTRSSTTSCARRVSLFCSLGPYGPSRRWPRRADRARGHAVVARERRALPDSRKGARGRAAARRLPRRPPRPRRAPPPRSRRACQQASFGLGPASARRERGRATKRAARRRPLRHRATALARPSFVASRVRVDGPPAG